MGLAVSRPKGLARNWWLPQHHQGSLPQVSHPVDLLGSYSAFMAQVKCPLYWEALYHNGSLRAEPNPESQCLT